MQFVVFFVFLPICLIFHRQRRANACGWLWWLYGKWTAAGLEYAPPPVGLCGLLVLFLFAFYSLESIIKDAIEAGGGGVG